jgi:hypothetical protein
MKLDRSKEIGNLDTINWLKKRCSSTVKESYLMTKNEFTKYQDIKNVFNNFDFDKSGINHFF